MSDPIVIAIDGPSASGKSTVSQQIAYSLGYHHMDTGSMYRALTWKVLEEGIDPHDHAAVLQLMKRIRYECDFVEHSQGPVRLRNRIDGIDPGDALRTPQVEAAVSLVAAIPEVREWMVQKQRQLAELGNVVIEGRDIGTVVFPNTPFKFYLEADPEVRARRRAADQAAAGIQGAKVQVVSDAMSQRDHKDSTRKVAPLKVAEDAVRLDTSYLSVQESADIILKHLRSRHLASVH